MNAHFWIADTFGGGFETAGMQWCNAAHRGRPVFTIPAIGISVYVYRRIFYTTFAFGITHLTCIDVLLLTTGSTFGIAGGSNLLVRISAE